MRDLPAREAPPEPALSNRWDRWRAHLFTNIVDHGVFRLIYQNRHEVAPGVMRSNQPTPAHLARLKAEGLRTVVNLRGHGKNAGYYLLERDACDALGLNLVDFPVRSRDVPSRNVLEAAIDLFKTIEYPALFHCKSGADRAGFMSALYLLAHERRPVQEAAGQLHWRFGHWRRAKTGILDKFFEIYQAYEARTGGNIERWLAEEYDPDVVRRDFHENRWATLFVDRVLRRE